MWQQVTDLLFLENCKKLVSSSKDTNVRVWDLDTQSCVQRVVSNRSAVWSLDADPLERHLVIGSADPELRVYGIAPNEVCMLLGSFLCFCF
jgi:U3 small nucleolar RNA-associated protein 12